MIPERNVPKRNVGHRTKHVHFYIPYKSIGSMDRTLGLSRQENKKIWLWAGRSNLKKKLKSNLNFGLAVPMIIERPE